MTAFEKHIVKTYAQLFEGLSNSSKIKLMEQLDKSLKNDNKKKETEFFKSFGGFGSDKSAKDIIKELKESREFKKRDLNLI